MVACILYLWIQRRFHCCWLSVCCFSGQNSVCVLYIYKPLLLPVDDQHTQECP